MLSCCKRDIFSIRPTSQKPTPVIKRIHYTSTEEMKSPLLESMSEEGRNGRKVVDSDIFDMVTDAALGLFLRRVLDGDSQSQTTWSEWLRREGSETYVYMTIGLLLGSVAMRSLEVSDYQTILLPECKKDVRTVPRVYYDRYLRKQLSNPLPDAKQLILFKAMDIKKDSQDVARGLNVISRHCTRETISRVYGPIMKGVM